MSELSCLHGSEGYEVRSDEAECRISRLWRLSEARSAANLPRERGDASFAKVWYPIPRPGRVLEIES